PDNTIINDQVSITADIPGTYTVTVYYGFQNRELEIDVFEKVNQNYVITETVRIPGITTSSAVEELSVGEMNRMIMYYDGLGRPMQQVTQQASPDKNDIVVPIAYDEFGREPRNYLPYVADGKF